MNVEALADAMAEEFGHGERGGGRSSRETSR
jgi:hypothetical protein